MCVWWREVQAGEAPQGGAEQGRCRRSAMQLYSWDRAALLLFPPALSPGRPSLRLAAFPSHSLCQETHRPGTKGLYTHLATAPRPPALLPHSLELFQGSAGKLLPESSFLVFVGLRLIQICFSSSAAPTMFSGNLSSLVPLPALPKLRVPPS